MRGITIAFGNLLLGIVLMTAPAYFYGVYIGSQQNKHADKEPTNGK